MREGLDPVHVDGGSDRDIGGWLATYDMLEIMPGSTYPCRQWAVVDSLHPRIPRDRLSRAWALAPNCNLPLDWLE